MVDLSGTRGRRGSERDRARRVGECIRRGRDDVDEFSGDRGFLSNAVWRGDDGGGGFGWIFYGSLRRWVRGEARSGRGASAGVDLSGRDIGRRHSDDGLRRDGESLGGRRDELIELPGDGGGISEDVRRRERRQYAVHRHDGRWISGGTYSGFGEVDLLDLLRREPGRCGDGDGDRPVECDLPGGSYPVE